MQILADANVPDSYVSALRGDDHEVIRVRSVERLGQDAADDDIADYAETEGLAILSTDVKDFAHREAAVPILVAPQDMTGGAVRSAVSRLEAMPFDASVAGPIWLSGLAR